ncbi:alpha-L-arabinofuranosidase C-terminal domain-containing protein [Portibacter marinus]|uniref:alpha-L-arabinofuranosidase C-terminal domain-containing protein n=1 Tax=Portibacter marinus TaxID=2898660 RepID=UPI001F162003|nr:alpha-L-arabinofuranosidase C-terminal domain-containing protein [Portibacter marinus]
MKKILVLLISFYCFQGISQSSLKRSINIDWADSSTSISPMLYGQFIEYLGRCINGGLYDKNSPLSDENGFRKDVLSKVKELHVPLLRFPGGTVTKIYHWQDGIGPQSQRPKKKNLIWGGVEDNQFGTAEFISYCREIGAEPFLVVNMATGSPEEASRWVEYCNGTSDSYYANLRRSHGYEQPFNVKYWGIGNEEYAEADAGRHQDVDDYIKDTWQFIKLMRLQDSDIKITLVGSTEDTEWNEKVINELHPVFDFLAIHFYAVPDEPNLSSLLESIDSYRIKLDQIRPLIANAPEKVETFPRWYRFPARKQPLKLAIDEWGIWDMDSPKGKCTYNLEYPYEWYHALGVGKFLHMFQKNADIIGLATWAQLVNILAPIMTTESGSYKQTVFYPLEAYRNYSLENHLPLELSDTTEISSYDAMATMSSDKRKLSLSIINFKADHSLDIELIINGMANNQKLKFVDHISYSAPSFYAVNDGTKEVVDKKILNIDSIVEGKIDVEIKPATINFLRFELSDD